MLQAIKSLSRIELALIGLAFVFVSSGGSAIVLLASLAGWI